ncbi:MAG TPA: hypothetical protein VGB66_12890, partial [Longimicrobium sp.]
MPSTEWPAEPVVLYVYPDSEFGLLRKLGFQQGATGSSVNRAPHVEYFAASLSRLKSGDISEVKDELVRRLEGRSVAAVVAPSVTEATVPVVRLVREAAREHDIPIILESSIAVGDFRSAGTGSCYRLSSGVDARGAEIGHVMASLARRNRNVGVIAENDGTYGGKMLAYARATAPAIESCPVLKYAPGELGSRAAESWPSGPPHDGRARVMSALRDPNAVIFFFGIGQDLKALIDFAFRERSAVAANAKLVGVMNAYMLAQVFEDEVNPARTDLIFDVTDFDFISPFNPPAAAVDFATAFAGSRPLTPALRDQAYSYDEAAMLAGAIVAADGARTYEDGLARMNRFLAHYSARGVTGSIVLDRGGRQGESPAPLGQNIGSTILRLAA